MCLYLLAKRKDNLVFVLFQVMASPVFRARKKKRLLVDALCVLRVDSMQTKPEVQNSVGLFSCVDTPDLHHFRVYKVALAFLAPAC